MFCCPTVYFLFEISCSSKQGSIWVETAGLAPDYTQFSILSTTFGFYTGYEMAGMLM